MHAKIIAIIVCALVGTGQALAQDVNIARKCAKGVPAQSTFDDKNHKLWYNRFWTGNCDPSLGWCSAGTPNWITTMGELEAAVPAAKRPAFRATLCSLGYKIGMEWSRDNALRRIDTADISRFYATLRDTSVPVQMRVSSVDRQATALLKK